MADLRPNILLILADDLGYSDLGCYGGEIETPNLDRLAACGLRFSHFYNNAVCMATRASLLTGIYPHQVSGGDPYGNSLADDRNATIAELLRDAGYRTLMVGKWHNGLKPHQLPVIRGFDRYWGLLSGCSNYFNPGLKRPGEPEPAHKFPNNTRPWGDDARVIHPFTPDDPHFYTTDVFTDRAVEFLRTYGREDRPFFLYLAHCAPHFPMQAWPGDIAKYRGRYRAGWDDLRERRYDRLKAIGLIEEAWGLSPRDERAPDWRSVEDPDSWDLKMAVYAAMVDRMDRGIGRVLNTLRDLGKEDNTLVLFLSDNGGCGQHHVATPDVPPGPVNSYHTVDAPWANLSNTPFRLFKVFNHEGGVATPLIVSWPRVIRDGGRITHQVGHIMDFMPTFLELAGAAYPDVYARRLLHPLEGQSFAAVLRGESARERGPICWELGGCRAVLDGGWKLVTQGPGRRHVGMDVSPGHEGWELYHMPSDRSELNDLTASEPGRALDLASRWQDWKARMPSRPA